MLATAGLAAGLAPAAASAQPSQPARVIAIDAHPRLNTGVTSSGPGPAALTAYDRYLTGLNNAQSSSESSSGQLVDTVQSNCSDALADLNGGSSRVSRASVSAFGDEVDADLDLAYMAPTRSALKRFAAALNAIGWPSQAQGQIASGLIAAERGLLGVSQSNLCADATTLDAAPLSEPTATLTFLKRYRAAEKRLHTALTNFQSLLSGYETASEQKLVNNINAQVANFSSQSDSVEQTDAGTVLSELGITNS